MEIIKLLAAAVIIAFLYAVIKEYKSEYALVVQIAGVVFLGIYIASQFSGIRESVEEIIQKSSIDVSMLSLLIKALIISVLTDFASSFCKDSGSETLGKGVELLGKTAILALSFPLLETLAETAIGFME